MKFRKFLTLCPVILGLSFSSCSDTKEISSEEFGKMSVDSKIEYISDAFPDEASVSRMLEATPENIDLISHKQAVPSKHFQSRINEVGNFYISSDYNNAKTLKKFDSEYSWYDVVWDCEQFIGWFWFVAIIVVLIVLSALCENGAPLFIPSVFWAICGLLSFINFCFSEPIETEAVASVIAPVANSVAKEATPDIQTIKDTATNDMVDTVSNETNSPDANTLSVRTDEQSNTVVNDRTVADTTVANNVNKEAISDLQSNEDTLAIEVSDTNSTVINKHDSDTLSAGMDTTTSAYVNENQAEYSNSSETDENPAQMAQVSQQSTKSMNLMLPSSPNFKPYGEVYNQLISRGLSIDSISHISGIKPEKLIKMRYGEIDIPAEALTILQKIQESDNPHDIEAVDLTLTENNYKPTLDVYKYFAKIRTADLNEALASAASDYYSNKVDNYLEDKFGFFSSIWQGIKYTFSSKESYVAGIEKDLNQILDKSELSSFIITYLNGYKHTIESETKVLFDIDIQQDDFKELTLFSSLDSIDESVREKLIERGAVEAGDLGSSVMFDLLGWLISVFVLTAISNMLIRNAMNDKLAMEGFIDSFNPESTWGKIGKKAAKVANEFFYGSEIRRIKDRYNSYKATAGIAITIISYVVSYYFFIEPSVKLDIEINDMMTSQFLEYFNSLDIPTAEMFNNLISSL